MCVSEKMLLGFFLWTQNYLHVFNYKQIDNL